MCFVELHLLCVYFLFMVNVASVSLIFFRNDSVIVPTRIHIKFCGYIKFFFIFF